MTSYGATIPFPLAARCPARPRARADERAGRSAGGLADHAAPPPWPSTTPAAPRRWRGALLALLLPAMAAAAYIPAIRGGFIWDDDVYVTDNPTLRDLGGLRRIWLEPGATTQYYPLVHTTFWIECRLWGLRPLGYHLVNVLLHGVGAVLVWRVGLRLGLGGAWWVAAIFALHPVHAESVAWVTERKNVLSGALYLATMLAYLRFHGPVAECPAPSGRRGWYAAALLLFACALLSKTVTCSLPAAILVLLWWKRSGAVRRALPWAAPMFVLGVALAAVTVLVEKHIIGAKGAEFDLSAVQRCLIAGRAVAFYAGKLLWPVRLTFIYPRWEVDVRQWWQWLYPVAVLGAFAGLALLAWRKRAARGILAAAALFVGTLLPALGFVNVYPMRYSFVADHFQYLASLAVIALVVGLAAAAARRLGKAGAWAALAPGAALLVMLGGLTWRQAGIYRDQETLWRDTIAKNPRAVMAYANLGTFLLHQERAAEAAETFRAAIRLRPDAPLFNDLGAALEMLRSPEARQCFTEAVRLKPDDADYQYNLGRYLVDHGRLREGVEVLEKLVKARPAHANAWDRLGVAAFELGDSARALDCFQKAVRAQPDLATARIDLAAALLKLARHEEAARQAKEGVRLRPEELFGHGVLRSAMEALGRGDELADFYAGAVRQRPDEPHLRYQLGRILARRGDVRGGLAQLREAARLRADWPPVLNELALLLAAADDPRLRNGAEALRLAKRSCELTKRRDPLSLDALAAACAEAGRFDEAVETAREAAAAATAAGEDDLAGQIQSRLRLYESGRPFRLAAARAAGG